MEKQLRKISAYALSNDDIQKILEPDTNIFTYPKFAHMKNIDEAFDELGRCIFLFLTQSETSGHWLCMYKKGNSIFYFDSYGEKPDAQRCWLSQEQLDSLGEGRPFLTELLRASGYKVYYSPFQYQSDKENMNSCGRWCVARLLCKDLTNDQFHTLIKTEMKAHDIKDYDVFVSMFIHDILNK